VRQRKGKLPLSTKVLIAAKGTRPAQMAAAAVIEPAPV